MIMATGKLIEASHSAISDQVCRGIFLHASCFCVWSVRASMLQTANLLTTLVYQKLWIQIMVVACSGCILVHCFLCARMRSLAADRICHYGR